MTAVNWGRVSRPAFTAAGDAAVWRDDGQPRRYSTFSRHAPLAALHGPLHPAAAALRPRPGEVPSRYPPAMGNALIARMATTALRKGMNLRLNVNVLTLCEAQGAVRGVEIEYQGQRERCTPAAGWCWPQAASPRARWRRAIGRTPASISPCRRRPTMAPRCISRRRLTLAREPIGPPTFLGAGIGADPGRRQRGALPHLVTDRAKPGVIAVNQRAVRFVNESSSYHHFASAMQDAAENAPCFYSATPGR